MSKSSNAVKSLQDQLGERTLDEVVIKLQEIGYGNMFSDDFYTWAVIIVGIVFGICAFIGMWMIITPIYNVWAERKKEQANREAWKVAIETKRNKSESQLAEAKFAEKVAVAEATARLAAADENKKAEIVEAEAVSESIKIIGDSLKMNESYLRWQWIKKLDETDNNVIYVPTEANMPIMEAGKRETGK